MSTKCTITEWQFFVGLAGIMYIAIFYFCDTYPDTVWPYRDIFKSIYSKHMLLEYGIALKAI